MSGLSLGKKFLFMGVLIVVILTGLHYSAGAIDRFTPLGAAVRDVMAPVQRVLMLVGREIYDFASAPARLIGLSERNQILEQRNRELESQLLQFKEFEEENYRLKNMLEFKTGMDPQLDTEVAAVTGRDHGNWFGSIMINKGANKGIRRDMAVITPAGLVGKVFRVSRHTAEVLLITDPRSGVGSLVQETRAHGILEGVPGGGYCGWSIFPRTRPRHPATTLSHPGWAAFSPKVFRWVPCKKCKRSNPAFSKWLLWTPTLILAGWKKCW